MKRLLIILSVLVTTISSATGQTYYKSTKDGKAVSSTSRWKNYGRSQYWAVRVGVAFSHGWFTHGEMSSIQTSARTGVSLAVLYGKQIASPDVPLFIETGLRYVQKGFSTRFGYSNDEYQYRHNMNYLEVPVQFKYKIKTGVDDLTVQPFLGGFFDLGVGSESLRYAPSLRKKFDTFGDDVFSRVDAGIRIGVGLAYQNFYFEMAYDWGMTNNCGDKMSVATDTDSNYYPQYTGFDERAHNGCFSMSIGIDF